MTRIVAVVESRMSSTRLPGKNLKPILGRPMVSRLLERVKQSAAVNVICLATSRDPSDDPLEAVARAEGVACYRGSLEDVLSRTLEAAQSVHGDVIVEITGDCPLIDPSIIDAMLSRYLKGGFDYVANVLDHLSFPIGLDVQLFAVDLLAKINRLTNRPYDRANVTPFIYQNPQRYRLLNLYAPPGLHRPQYRLCVDYPQDFDVVTTIYETLYPQNPHFDASDMIQLLDARPDLARHNTSREDAFLFPTSGGAATQDMLSVTHALIP